MNAHAQPTLDSPAGNTSKSIAPSVNNGVKILGIDQIAFPKTKVNIFIDKFCAMDGKLKKENFKVKENGKDTAIDNLYFTGNASGKKLDLAIVFDDTGSMGKEIGAMKSKVKDLTDTLKALGLEVNYSLVSFKDSVSVKTKWTNDPEIFKKIIDALAADGGNDEPEDSLDAVEAVLSMGFRPDAQKVILVITDAHAHYKNDSSIFSQYTKEDIEKDLKDSGAIFVPVSPTFAKPSAYVDLRKVANDTQSMWIDINSAEFSTILEQFKGMLTGTYVIEYTSPDQTPSENRTVLVSVNAPGCVEGDVSGTAPPFINNTISYRPGTYELRGAVADLSINEFIYANASFAGFYHDIDKNIGAEQITFRLSIVNPASATLSDQPDVNNNRGVVYTTTAQPKNFKFKPWGQYEVIGFLGTQYFAAYDNRLTQGMADANANVPYLYDRSTSRNLLTNEQLSKVLIDNDTEILITSSTPLKLMEGYELGIESINVNETKAILELKKNGQNVDTKIVQPTSKLVEDTTYYYKTILGGTIGIVTIGVHFKNIVHGTDRDSATIDGVFQISDTVTPLKIDQQYDKMSIRSVNPTDMTVMMDNKDNQITLSKNKDIVLMQNIHIRTADQDIIDTANPLRYFIYKNYTEPGMYELRGSVANLGIPEVTWTGKTFPGLYYDLNKSLGTEQITFRLTNANPARATLSDQPDANGNRGIVYNTTAQLKNFKFRPWGMYQLIGFLGGVYFAAYNSNGTQGMVAAGESVPFLYDRSKSRNLMIKEQLSKVLIDDNKEQVIKNGSSLLLKEGYELTLKGIDDKGHLYVELLKKGQSIDTKEVQPSIDNATMADKTYYYTTDLGDVKDIVTVAIHFKNFYRDKEQAFATVDGVWQISETAMPIKIGQQYDRMSIRTVNPSDFTISMDNKDNQITLSKNENVTLMQNIYLRTADQDVIDEANPLRYYIFTPITIEPEAINELASTNGPENETTATNLKPIPKAVDARI